MMNNISDRLKEIGLLSLNRRNAEYILAHNPRRLYPLVDDKYRTKKIALKAGLAVPDLYGVVNIEYQIRDLPVLLGPYRDFVIKPSRGSGGNGIMVISDRSKQMYRKIDGLLLNETELGYHVSNILSGMYSLGGQPDKALIEYRVKFNPL
ncbi:sugar-transfer associated ATP-grasp domain-containing protein, partial [Thermodesulfobacteriota bacterium]